MNLYLLNTSLEIIDVIDTYKSIIWTTRYFTAGDFELYIPVSEKMLNQLRRDYYLVREDDMTQAMIINKIQIDTDVELGNYLIVTGKSLKSILHRRIVWEQTMLQGKVEFCIRQLLDDNITNSSISERNVTNLVLGTELGTTSNMSSQYTGDNLGEIVENLCKTHGLGYDILLDLEEKLFIFVLYQGADRSYNQTENPRVIFSNEFDNLLRSSYTHDSENYKNVAKVAGEGEGIARKSTVVGTASGLNRYELFVDARDVSSNDGSVDDTTYTDMLAERGVEALSETTMTENIEGEIENNHTYVLNQDYFLGDIIEVVNEYGISMTPRVTEVIETVDDTGTYVIPTFSTSEEVK